MALYLIENQTFSIKWIHDDFRAHFIAFAPGTENPSYAVGWMVKF